MKSAWALDERCRSAKVILFYSVNITAKFCAAPCDTLCTLVQLICIFINLQAVVGLELEVCTKFGSIGWGWLGETGDYLVS